MIKHVESGGKSPARVATEIVINRILKDKAKKERILEIGSKNNIERGLLDNDIYITSDIVNGINIDVVCDAHNLPFKNDFFDLIMCQEVLEHLESPTVAINEMNRVLRFGGEVILSTRFIFPLHRDPKDFYRFTEDGLRQVFSEFKSVEVYPAGGLVVSLTMLLLHALPEKMRKHRITSWIGKIPTKRETRFACGYVVNAIK
jgi:SAM-dependent methyltransferase